MKIIILLAILLQSTGLAFSEMKKVQLLIPQELTFEVFEFEEEYAVKYGAVDKEMLDKYPHLRILQAPWLLVLDRETDEKTYISYFPLEDNKDGKKYLEFESGKKQFPTSKSLTESEYGKRFGVKYVRGISVFEHDSKKYCVIDYSLTKGDSKTNVVATQGVYEEGLWRMYNNPIEILPSIRLPLGPTNVLDKGAKSGFLYKDLESGSMKAAELKVVE